MILAEEARGEDDEKQLLGFISMIKRQKKVTGRPPKFAEPCRPITVTLPERILRKLSNIHADRARAIVKSVDSVTADSNETPPLVELVEVGPGQSLIVVGPSQALKKIPWLRLVEIAPSRYLLSIPSGTPVDSLELALLDILERLPPGNNHERSLVGAVQQKINSVRRACKVSKAEILFVSTE